MFYDKCQGLFCSLKLLFDRRHDLCLMVDIQIIIAGIKQLIYHLGARSRIERHILIPGQSRQLRWHLCNSRSVFAGSALCLSSQNTSMSSSAVTSLPWFTIKYCRIDKVFFPTFPDIVWYSFLFCLIKSFWAKHPSSTSGSAYENNPSSLKQITFFVFIFLLPLKSPRLRQYPPYFIAPPGISQNDDAIFIPTVYQYSFIRRYMNPGTVSYIYVYRAAFT